MKQKTYVTVLKVLAAIVLLFIALFPIYWLVAMAIRPTSEMTGHISVIPATLTIEHFVELFTEKGFGAALVNSLQTTLISLVFSMAFGLCTAYVIARRRFRFRIKRPLSYWVLLVRVLPPVAFTIPLYTMFSRLGILNTKIPATLACVLINVPFIIWFMISFFQDLPEEVEESAKVDSVVVETMTAETHDESTPVEPSPGRRIKTTILIIVATIIATIIGMLLLKRTGFFGRITKVLSLIAALFK